MQVLLPRHANPASPLKALKNPQSGESSSESEGEQEPAPHAGAVRVLQGLT